MSKRPKRSRALQRKDAILRNTETLKYPEESTYKRLVELKSTRISDLEIVLNSFSDDELEKGFLRGLFPDLGQLGEGVVTPNTGDIEAERNWLIAITKRFRSRINAFIEQKRDFELFLFRRDFDQAQAVLNNFQSVYGWSLWLIQSRLSLAQAKGGFEENRETLTEIRLDASIICGLVADFYSLRVEDDVAPSHFARDVSRFVERQLAFSEGVRASKKKVVEAYMDFIRLKLDFFRFTSGAESLTNFAYVSGSFSLVDQYLSLAQLVHHFASNRSPHGRIPFGTLEGVFNDCSLSKAIQVQVGCSKLEENESQLRKHLELVEAYTIGDYSRAIRLASSLLKQDPMAFECYEFLAKSLLASASDGSNVEGLEEEALRTLTLVLNTLRRNESSAKSLVELFKLSLGYCDSLFSRQIFAFFIENRLPFYQLDWLSLSSNNMRVSTPRRAVQFRDSQKAMDYLEHLEEVAGTHACIDLFRSLISNDASLDIDSRLESVPDSRKQKYKAICHGLSKNHAAAARAYLQVWNDRDLPAYVHGNAISSLYGSFMELEMFHECARIIVEAALRNPFLLINVRTRHVLEALRGNRPENLAQRVDRALLYAIAVDFDREVWDLDLIYDLLEDVLLECEASSPLDLMNKEELIDKDRLLMFLHKICTIDVIDSWPSFCESGTKGVEDERIAICMHLQENHKHVASELASEITYIRRIQAIRRGIQHIDETKIYVDLEGIKTSLGSDFDEKYERLVNVTSLPIEQVRRRVIAEAGEQVRIIMVGAEGADDGLQLFIDMFDLVRDRYVTSDEFGLDSYVGMQIRHGALVNQIRAIFESSSLVTESDEGVYEPNLEWRNRLSDGGVIFQAEKLDELFSSFSASVDETLEYIRDNWIQISLDKDDSDALFNFHFSLEEYQQFYTEIGAAESVDAFTDAILDALVRRTGLLLDAARDRFQVNLVERFDEYLNELNAGLETSVADYDRSELARTIVDSRTELHTSVKRVAGWFRFDTDQTFQDFDFSDAVQAAVEIFSVSFHNQDCFPELSVECSGAYSGSTFRPFINMFFILLENIFRHASPISQPVTISAEEEDGRLKIAVSNGIPDEVDISEVESIAASINDASSFKQYSRLIRQEGKSGWPKLLKILSVDLGRSSQATSIAIEPESRTFEVEIEMELEGMKA